MKNRISIILPILGALGFIVFSELSLLRQSEFVIWSLATLTWILIIFAGLAFGHLKGRLLWIAIPSIAMIAISTVSSLLFLDLISPRRGFIFFFAAVLYLFLEHVRHEIVRPDAEEQLYITEFARMVNIGSLFLVTTVALGVSIFLPISSWWTTGSFIAVALLWSWHLFAACHANCGKPWPRVLLTALVVVETYLVVLRLPTSMFVGGALTAVVYYLAGSMIAPGASSSTSPKLARRYLYAGLLMVLAILLTARWK